MSKKFIFFGGGQDLRRMTNWQNSQWLRSGDSDHRMKPETIKWFLNLQKGMGAYAVAL